MRNPATKELVELVALVGCCLAAGCCHPAPKGSVSTEPLTDAQRPIRLLVYDVNSEYLTSQELYERYSALLASKGCAVPTNLQPTMVDLDLNKDPAARDTLLRLRNRLQSYTKELWRAYSDEVKAP